MADLCIKWKIHRSNFHSKVSELQSLRRWMGCGGDRLGWECVWGRQRDVYHSAASHTHKHRHTFTHSQPVAAQLAVCLPCLEREGERVTRNSATEREKGSLLRWHFNDSNRQSLVFGVHEFNSVFYDFLFSVITQESSEEIIKISN